MIAGDCNTFAGSENAFGVVLHPQSRAGAPHLEEIAAASGDTLDHVDVASSGA
jgi:hypothetical protein